MRDKQYFTVDDLDTAHRAGVAFGLTSSSKGRGNTGTRVEEALALLKRNRGGTKVEDEKAKDASKLLLGLGLSAAAISAATGGSKKAEGEESKGSKESSNNSSSSSSSKGKAGTELPYGLTIGKDGNATPAIDGKIASMLGMVSKVATGVHPLLGAILGLGTSFLSKDLTGKADEFNKKEEVKFKSLLSEKDKDFTDYATLQSLLAGTNETEVGSLISQNNIDSTDSDNSEPNYNNGSTDT